MQHLKNSSTIVVMIQESKKDTLNSAFIKSLWSSKDIGWDYVASVGSSGGILTMWDSSKISVTEVIKRHFSLSIKCLTLCKKVCWITNVYGPCGCRERKLVWPELSSLADCSAVAWCIGGDFNITRWACERFPFGRKTRGMSLFNKFIDMVSLMEIPLQNGRFTWSRDGSSP